MSDLKDIKARHAAVRGYFADQKGTDAHFDRSWLIEEVERLTAENKRLFDAHAVEMVRADRLKGALEFETERANGLAEELDRLEKWKAYHEEISKNRVDLESDLRAEVERLRILNTDWDELLEEDDE